MQKSIVKQKLKDGKPVFVAKTLFLEPNIVEIMGLMGYDCVWICNEHLGIAPANMANMIRAGRTSGIDCVIRTGEQSYDDFIRFLEMGANGLMIPHVKTAEQARQIVSRIKFAPLGRRGIDGVSADADFGLIPLVDYMKVANEETFIVVQIEDVESIKHLEKITQVEGIDVVFVGAKDLSIDMGIPGQMKHSSIAEVIKRVVKACENTNTVCGTSGGTTERVKELLEMGVKYITGVSDWGLLMRGLKNTRQDFEKIGFTFRD